MDSSIEKAFPASVLVLKRDYWKGFMDSAIAEYTDNITQPFILTGARFLIVPLIFLAYPHERGTCRSQCCARLEY